VTMNLTIAGSGTPGFDHEVFFTTRLI
jgi:hypothetical protein